MDKNHQNGLTQDEKLKAIRKHNLIWFLGSLVACPVSFLIATFFLSRKNLLGVPFIVIYVCAAIFAFFSFIRFLNTFKKVPFGTIIGFSILLYICLSVDVGAWVPIVGIFVGGIASLIWLLKSRQKKNKIGIVLSLVFALAFIGEFFVAHHLFSYQMETIKKEGNKIVVAIEAYKEKNGSYPESLSNLVPEFLDEIPKRKGIGSSGFTYFKKSYKDGDDYSFFTTIGMNYIYYSRPVRKWIVHSPN